MTAMLPTIRAIRPMTQEELAAEGWAGIEFIPLLIETTDGSVYYSVANWDFKPWDWYGMDRLGKPVNLRDPKVVARLIGQTFPFLNHGQRDYERLRWQEDAPDTSTQLRFDCGITLEPVLVFGRLSNGTPFVLG